MNCLTNTVFQELKERYPTWDQLEQYLESEDGGLFRVIDRDEEKGLSLIRYEKETSNMDLPHSNWFRSVVWDHRLHAPVSISPPKTSSTEFPFATRQEAVDAGMICQEHLDGFMINCFKRVGDDQLYITSRSKLDASGHFYSGKSFRHLFVEAYTGWIIKEGEPVDWLIQSEAKNIPSPDPNQNEVATCYSFLVQHTEHRIVTPISENSVTLLHKAIIYTNGSVLFEDTPDPSTISNSRCIPLTFIPLIDGSDQIREWVNEQLRSQSWQVQGLIFKDRSGNRWRFRSDAYQTVRSLRGNTANKLDRFIQLYLQNLVYIYMEYYPEDREVFSFHHKTVNYVINTIYKEYQQLHVRNTTTIDKINKMYHPHLYAIHGHYLTHLRPEKKKVTLNDVHDYLRKQPWQRVAFLLRAAQDSYYEMIRSHNVQS